MAAKLYNQWNHVNYREAYGFRFNNRSLSIARPRRGEGLYNPKIARAVAGIAQGGNASIS
jgi:GDP-D-mannose dehydratase